MAERRQIVGIYPGSFDPVTRGHMGIIATALMNLDKVYVVLAVNENKKDLMFTGEERMALLKASIKDFEKEVRENPKATSIERAAVERLQDIEIIEYKGRIVDLAMKIGSYKICRGLRDGKDFDYELSLAYDYNLDAKKNDYPIVVEFLPNIDERYHFTSSSLIRKHAGNPNLVDHIYPSVLDAVNEKFRQTQEKKAASHGRA
jgi:pantetheine-phosphate adenylyltransferase